MTMQPGAELDALISKLTGHPLIERFDGDHYEWTPSTCADDALDAAEGFLALEVSRHKEGFDGKWLADIAWRVDESTVNWISGGAGETAAHAICLAILAAKEQA